MTQQFTAEDMAASADATSAAAAVAAAAVCAAVSSDAASVVPVVEDLPSEERFAPSISAPQLDTVSDAARVAKVAATLTVEEAMAVAEAAQGHPHEHEQQDDDAQVLQAHQQLEGHVDALAAPVTSDPTAHMDMMPQVTPLSNIAQQPAQQVKKKRKTYSTEEERRRARILKNRRTAEESRQRRMKRMKELEDFVASSAMREKELQEDARTAKLQLGAESESFRQIIAQKDAEIEQKDAEIQRLREKLASKLSSK